MCSTLRNVLYRWLIVLGLWSRIARADRRRRT